MQNLKVTLVQANQIWEDKQANFANYNQLLSDNETGDLILLPEMFHTGFSMNNTVLAEKMEDSEGISWLKKLAQTKKAAVYTSMIISENGHFYNRGLFIEPNGTLTVYDKRKTFGLANEDQFYESGKRSVIVEFKGWKIMLQICYDLRFPEIVRNQLVDGNPNYDLLLYVANWPTSRKVHWNTLLRARAIENQCYVAAVNRVGEAPNNLHYSGNSQVVDLLGEIQEAEENTESVYTIELDATHLNSIREKLPFLKDAEIK